jgi:predicted small integral membrane protein
LYGRINRYLERNARAYRRLTWQGLENANIHVGLVLMVAYTVCITVYGIGRPELRQSVAFFA